MQDSSGASRHKATLAGLAAIVLWSTLAVLTTSSGAIPPFQLLAMGFAIGGLTSTALVLVRTPRGARRGGFGQPWAAFALAAASLFGYHALYFIALKTAPAVEANLLNYLWPLLIVLLSALLPGQRPRPLQYFGAVLGLAGAALIVTRGQALAIDATHVPGYAAALGAALIWSGYSVANRRFAHVPSSAIAGPCLAVAIAGALAHGLWEQTVMPTGLQWLAIALMGLGPVGAAFALWDTGTKRGDLALLGTLAYAAPLLSTLWLLLGGAAAPHWTHGLACALIVAGGVVSATTGPRSASPESDASSSRGPRKPAR
jgi:drug/metabolite transporter (DMT)-like permease